MDYYSSDSHEDLNSIYDFVICGAGLAGLCLAVNLCENGKKVLVVDKSGLGGGASGTKVGLMNPATAQKAILPEDASYFVDEFYKMVRKVGGENPAFLLQNSVIRAASDEKLHQNFRKSFDEYPWPDGWNLWISEQELKELYPNIRALGAMNILKGCSVDVPRYLQRMSDYCKMRGVEFVIGEIGEYNLLPSSDTSDTSETSETSKLLRFSIRLNPKNDSDEVSASNHNRSQSKEVIVRTWNLIFCSGEDLVNRLSLKLNRVKGQLAGMEITNSFDINHAFSAYGYMAKGNDGLIYTGSTYEHHFENKQPDEKGKLLLINKFRRLFDVDKKHLNVKNQWSGVRVTTSDKKPFIGSLEENGIYYFGGLGSKGLYYSAGLAKVFSNLILNKSDSYELNILDTYSMDRFKTKKPRDNSKE